MNNILTAPGLSRLRRGKLVRRANFSQRTYGPFGGYVPFYSRHGKNRHRGVGEHGYRMGRHVMDDFGNLVPAAPQNFHGMGYWDRGLPSLACWTRRNKGFSRGPDTELGGELTKWFYRATFSGFTPVEAS